jgi:pyruvate/2-oxoglutarate dehydrogenase complex dihydrolipoamide acyltransferase (E2) component
MDRDPSELTDEELEAAIANGGAEPEPVQPPGNEAAADPDPDPQPDPEPEPAQPDPQVEPDPELPQSRRESLRIAKLVERQLQERQLSAPQPQNALNYADKLEVDNPQILKDLENDRRTVSDQAYQAGIRQAETISWKSSLRMESPIVQGKYKFLDNRDPANFNPAAADAMNQKYLRYVGYTAGDPSRGVPESVQIPDVSYLEFVEAEMEFADEIARHRVENTTRNIAKQAATTGLRPDGSRAKRLDLNKDPEMMTDEELDARIAQAVPSKR